MASTLVWGRISHNFSQLLGDLVDAGERLGALFQVLDARVDVGLICGDEGLPGFLLIGGETRNPSQLGGWFPPSHRVGCPDTPQKG